MNIITILLQSIFDYQTRLQTERLREAGLRAAEKGRRMAVAAAFYTLSGAFFFSGLLLGVIELGLQVDRQQGPSYSGLMLSATILIFMGLACVLVGWVCGRAPREPEPSDPFSQQRPSNPLRDSLEEVAVMFLREFIDSHKAAKAQRPPHE